MRQLRSGILALMEPELKIGKLGDPSSRGRGSV
jgi:hypothetical protein